MSTTPPADAPVPYDQSVLYRLGERYYREGGLAPWSTGQVPFNITNNHGMALQYARLLLAVARSRPPEAPLGLLEVGGGPGMFAANLVRALEADCGDDGRALVARLRYVFSDTSAQTVNEVAAGPLAAAVDRGVVIPAVYDLATPEQLTDPAGRPLEIEIVGVIANYVCCVVPTKHLQKREDGWYELHVAVGGGEDVLARHAEAGVFEALQLSQTWCPKALDAVFDDAWHKKIVAAALATMAVGTVTYPAAFFDFLRRLPAAGPDAFVLVTDYGWCGRDHLEGPRHRTPRPYGNSVSHPVQFALFDTLAADLGWGVARSSDPLASVHHAALVRRPAVPEALRTAFEEAFCGSPLGQRAADLRTSAKFAEEKGDYLMAARLLRRALREDPQDTRLYLGVARNCVQADQPAVAIEYARRGMAQDPTGKLDFAFEIARAHYHKREFEAAITWYQRSLEQAGEHAVTWTNIAYAQQELGRVDLAREAAHRAAACDPEEPHTVELLAQLDGSES